MQANCSFDRVAITLHVGYAGTAQFFQPGPQKVENILKDFSRPRVTPTEAKPKLKGAAMNTLTMTHAGAGFRPARTSPMPAIQNDFNFQPRTLEQAIQSAVDEIEDGALEPLSADACQPFAQARAALALLTGCYARQIYSSTAAAELARHSPEFPWFWWEALPDAAALRRFRAANRAALQHCVAAALRYQVEQKFFAGVLARVNTPQLAEEAGRRIVVAAFVDSMEIGRDSGT